MNLTMINSEEIDEEDFSILCFRQGIPEAFKVFFFQYYPELFSFALLLVHEPQAAYQLPLDAFFLCWERRTDITSDQRLKSFLYLAVRNNCMDYQRRISDPAVTDKTAIPGPVPASLPPEMLRDIYAFASVGLSKRPAR